MDSVRKNVELISTLKSRLKSFEHESEVRRTEQSHYLRECFSRHVAGFRCPATQNVAQIQQHAGKLRLEILFGLDLEKLDDGCSHRHTKTDSRFILVMDVSHEDGDQS